MNNGINLKSRLTKGNAWDLAIGSTLWGLRQTQGLTARKLASTADVSSAMISRIENDQVSPLISKLSALAQVLGAPLASFFRETTDSNTYISYVKVGEELAFNWFVDGYSQEFINLAFHNRGGLQFEARKVTLIRHSAKPPVYVGHGVIFVHVLEGQAIYGFG